MNPIPVLIDKPVTGGFRRQSHTLARDHCVNRYFLLCFLEAMPAGRAVTATSSGPLCDEKKEAYSRTEEDVLIRQQLDISAREQELSRLLIEDRIR
jgi:hypothetical protein